MGQEIDLLKRYPRAKRNPSARAAQKTQEDIQIARKFGREFFDGERRHGYGGFHYQPGRWDGVIKDIIDYYAPFHSLLDVGCAKGFMLHDFLSFLPELDICGIDISPYAIDNAKEEIRPFVRVGNAISLPFEDEHFDLAVSINTLHNLPIDQVVLALQELQRVAIDCYVTLDAYQDEYDKQRMLDWNLTAQTILHVDEWKQLFDRAGYRGDYGWFMP